MNHLDIKDSPLKPLVIEENTSSIMVRAHTNLHVVVQASNKHELTVKLEEGANACLYFLPTANSNLCQMVHATVAANAHLRLFDFGLSAEGTITHDINVELIGSDAKIAYFGLDQLNKNAKKHSSLEIFHRASKTSSMQAFRGIYSGLSQGNFLGKVIVDKEAHQSSAKQLYKAIIADEKAQAHVMPQLEIYNSDISASHGASIGELDKSALFYLCSRGLSLAEAKSLLIAGLAQDILQHIDEPSIASLVNQSIASSIKDSMRE